MKPCVHKSRNSDSSRRHVINGSMYPLMIADFWIGIMIRNILFVHGMSCMIAASSISLLICSMEFNALRLANGMYLIVPAMISSVYVLKRLIFSLEKRMKNAAPTAMEASDTEGMPRRLHSLPSGFCGSSRPRIRSGTDGTCDQCTADSN